MGTTSEPLFPINPPSSNLLNTSNSSNLSTIAEELAVKAGNVPKRLCCPFCLFDFGFEFLLKSHIQDVHPQEVKLLSKTNPQSIRTDLCSYCGAKFYIHGLLPKHVIRKHQECIVGLTSSTSDDFEKVTCNFCHYQASTKQIKLLFIHLENKHLKNIDEMLFNFNTIVNDKSKNQNYFQSIDEQQHCNIVSTSNSSRGEVSQLKPILKRGSFRLDSVTLNETLTTEVSRKRKLRFDLPDTSFTSVGSDDDKENLPLRSITKRTFSLRIKKQRKSIDEPRPTPNIKPESRNVLGDITDIVHDNLSDILEPKMDCFSQLPFKCGLCSEKYANNSILVHHVKKKHGKIHLHPPYRCGLCKAKFFRNSYLLKHHNLHDKPKLSGSGHVWKS